MPTRREKRALKLPRLEKPTAMQTSVIDKSVRISRCLAFSICARERYWCGVLPKTALKEGDAATAKRSDALLKRLPDITRVRAGVGSMLKNILADFRCLSQTFPRQSALAWPKQVSSSLGRSAVVPLCAAHVGRGGW